jgi:hypothetical protein
MMNVQSQNLISYNKSDNVDFSKYKTFKVYSLDIENIPEFEPKKTGLNLLVEEINNQMISRGYDKVQENPDLIINLGVTITEEAQTRQTDIREAPVYVGQRNYHWESEEVVIGHYTEGTVTLDLVDAIKNEMIWQSVAGGVLMKKREKNRKKIVRAAQKLFKKYPIKAIK